MLFTSPIRLLLAGVIAGIMFCLTVYSSAGGALLVYLPVFPLLLLGLAQGIVSLFGGVLIAFIVITLGTDMGDALFFIGLIALPACYFVKKALLWQEREGQVSWYPVEKILAELTLLAAGLFMFATIMFSHTDSGGLQSVVDHTFKSNLDAADPEVTGMMKWLVGEGSFIIFAVAGWSWVLMLYGFAVLANRVLTLRQLTLRPGLGFSAQGLPLALLGVLLVSGALAWGGQGSDRFVGETVFLLLLLPYFLSGLALLHTASRSWQARGIWLTLFYIALGVSLWPALFAVGAGLYTQLAGLMKRYT